MNLKLIILVIFFVLLSGCDHSYEVYPQLLKSSTRHLKLCFFGDTGQNHPETQTLIKDELLKENCDRIYHLGDLVYPHGVDSQNDPKIQSMFFNYYDEILKSEQGKQIAIILGNHDYEGDPTAWIKLAEKDKRVFAPHNHFLELHDSLCILAIDTNLWIRTSHFYDGLVQALWIFNQRNRLKKCQKTIALTHHPYKQSIGHIPHGAFFNFFFENLILGEVDMVISGHDHIVSRLETINGTHQLISGAGGHASAGFLPGYVVIGHKNSSKELDYSLITINPSTKLKTQLGPFLL